MSEFVRAFSEEIGEMIGELIEMPRNKAGETVGMPREEAVFLGHDERLATHSMLLERMRALAFDLRAAAITGVATPPDLAEGLASVIDHAARSLDSGVGVIVDLDGV